MEGIQVLAEDTRTMFVPVQNLEQAFGIRQKKYSEMMV